MESKLKSTHNLLVLGSQKPGGEVLFNPPPDQALTPGMILIVMGDTDDIARARKEF